MKEVTNADITEENSHIMHLWEPLELNIDKQYKYVPIGMLFSFFQTHYIMG